MANRFAFWVKQRISGWSAQKLAILTGFVLTLLSTAGSALYLEPAEQNRARLDAEITAAETKARLLRSALSAVDSFVQFGGLVYAVKVDAEKQPEASEAIGELKLRALTQRRDGIRNYIAQLAFAGEVDFKTTMARYEALVEAESRDFTLENYRATNSFEGDLSMQAVKDQGTAAMEAINKQYARATAQQAYERRSLVILLVTVAGSTLILAATLMATKEELAKPTTLPPGSANGRDSTAARLIRLAIAQAQGRIAMERAGSRGGTLESDT